MENTNTIQFPNDEAEWFVSVDDKFRGPFKATEVYQKLQSKELSWIDYVYRESDGKWIRIADHPVFSALQPAPPKPKPVMTPPPPPPKAGEEVRWFLFQNDSQTGPYPAGELQRFKSAGQIHDNAFVWNETFIEWKPFNDIAELNTSVKTPPPAPGVPRPGAKEAVEKRVAPRKPLIAQVYVTNDSKVIKGICRDISVGGMQILTDQHPGAIGSTIRLNVTPPRDTGLAPFVAEAIIVRLLEDSRGFSFRFTQISDEAKKSIERYIT